MEEENMRPFTPLSPIATPTLSLLRNKLTCSMSDPSLLSPIRKVPIRVIREECAADLKLIKRSVIQPRRHRVSALVRGHQEDLAESDAHLWLSKHNCKPKQIFTLSERRVLRSWFRSLDTDGSGEVGFDELQDPLFSSGVLRSREDLRRLVAAVDKDQSGEIGFSEFIQAVHDNKLCRPDKLKALQKSMQQQSGGLSPLTQLSEQRRKNLLSNVVDGVRRRQEGVDNALLEKDAQLRDKRLLHLQLTHHDEKRVSNRYLEAITGVLQSSYSHQSGHQSGHQSLSHKSLSHQSLSHKSLSHQSQDEEKIPDTKEEIVDEKSTTSSTSSRPVWIPTIPVPIKRSEVKLYVTKNQRKRSRLAAMRSLRV